MLAGEAKAALRLVPPVDTASASTPPPGAPVIGLAGTGGRWARYAGKLGAAVTVTLCADSIRKGGHEPNDPDDSDVDLLQEALEEGLRLKFGDSDVPWWAGGALAMAGVYASMRVGAARLPPKDPPNTAGGAIIPDHTDTPQAPPPQVAADPPPPTHNRVSSVVLTPMRPRTL
jgi:hypothetical protein